jgi:DNA-binding NarL/FixJ family response regulator
VVLAEDHPAMATELHELLAAEYDVVDVVADGAALIDATQRQQPDAIVCDIAMPGVNGLAAVASILEARPDACVVFVTVQDNRAVIRRALGCGARGYVLKSDAGNELVSAVNEAIMGSCYLSRGARLALNRSQRSDPGDDNIA